MSAIRYVKFSTALLLSILAVLLISLHTASASKLTAPAYAAYDGKLFWFIHTSDTHIGASSTAASRLNWLVTTAKSVIQPEFIVVTGDLTDSTNGNWLGLPNGPYQAEWTSYRNILTAAGMTPNTYFDIPGNHDAYNDQNFAYYLANSIQGMATGRKQASWSRTFSWGGKYHFLGVNTADNTGAGFSILWPYGDYAGLDAAERTFINNELTSNADADLTMIFGHHPLGPTGNSQDTYLNYGLTEFEGLLQAFHIPYYGYGHTHNFDENFFTDNLNPGVIYFNPASLGKSDSNQYTLIAVDHNGISTITPTVGTWPVVLITAPLDRNMGGVVNPYQYEVPAGTSNPVRALVFDPGATDPTVQFRINSSTTWYPMNRMSGPVWEGAWNATGLSGLQTIEVRATNASSVTRNQIITVNVAAPVTPSYMRAEITGTGTTTRKGFTPAITFTRGTTIVVRAQVTKAGTSTPISGAKVTFGVSGPSSATISGISSSTGIVEAKWVTTAPSKRGTGGTPAGNYAITISSVSASGYTWDNVPSTWSITLN